MRKATWGLAVACGLALAAPAYSQRAVTFGGADPTQVRNVPIDTSHAIAPLPQGQLTRPQQSRLRSFFSRVFTFSSRPAVGTSQAPTTQGTQGANYLKNFGLQTPGAR